MLAKVLTGAVVGLDGALAEVPLDVAQRLSISADHGMRRETTDRAA
jgi:hypothetical protein